MAPSSAIRSGRTRHLAGPTLVALVVAVLAASTWSTPLAAADEGLERIRAEHWIVVDADSGAVVAGHETRTRTRPASTIKLLTALIALQRLDPTAPVPISATAASMPARRMAMPAGEQWSRDDLIHAALMASANDAAVALAEAAGGGSLDGYLPVAQGTAHLLGLEDDPFLPEPSGLDDEFAHAGGSLISVRDMAIIARAVLVEPALVPIMSKGRHDMVDLDGVGHYVIGHNRLLARYPGAIGMKTGGTRAAGSTLVAAAERNGRTMVAVLFRSPDMYTEAATLLDAGFATAPGAPGIDRLPAVVPDAAASVVVASAVDPEAVDAASAAPDGQLGFDAPSGTQLPGWARAATLLVVTLALRRSQVVVRQRQRAAARRRHVSQRGWPPQTVS